MLVEPTAEQDFFRETTARFLAARAPTSQVRRLRADPLGFDPAYWREGAALGWTSLLVPEDEGGGSVSGQPVVDLSLLAHEFGAHAAPGPLLPTNVVAAALAAARHEPDLLQELLSGEAVVAWCLEEATAGGRAGAFSTTIAAAGSGVVVRGQKRPVEAAGTASHLLVTGRTGDGLSQVLVPSDAPGVTIEPMRSVDVTRRFAAVRFDDVRLPADCVLGELGGADGQVGRQVQLALVILNAEAVGALQRAFDITLAWAFDRYTFGRPLASYQELKHRFADMKTWLEASHALSDAAAVDAASADAAELTSAAKAFIGQFGAELGQDCVQMHGGIGLTFDHDLHLLLRRQVVNRTCLGTPAAHRQRLAALVLAREPAA